ncbi:type II secretion system protein E [[Bacillus] enclensis]|uniref:Pilus assembly protein CpaF n=1 Tax=[Bacillus] enclensis TaxID=1402860 RepID=A0A0V8HEK6_9BACI|nr:CpaF family protein [[Bacillus] enclensis]KSU61059.1 type II secretion system protein E [[Bacillus] enclensis]SCC22486.1 pilus assembly protein CpaF [[Bacillus] enclensis]
MVVFNKVVTEESPSAKRVEKGRVRAQGASEFWETGSRLHHFIIEELKKQTGHNEEQEKIIIKELSEEFIKEEGGRMTFEEKRMLIESVEDELLGYGPITPLLGDHSISEIMVNGPKQVYYEQDGKLIRSSVTFRDDAHVQRVIEKIVSPIGRRVDESSPMVDARLPNGSRVNAIIPPLSLIGPTVTIRKFAESPFTVDDLIEFGSLNSEMAEFLKVCVMGRMNIFISGGTGSGKTSSLNVLSSFIPQDERIVTIEDAAELKLSQDHTVSLEARPKNIEGKGEITIRDLVRNALRMRPDRIVVGEVRGAEALDMLQAMNTGHDGSLSTGHANSPRDMLSRLETMVMMAGYDLPVRAIREQIANALDLIVQQVRLKDGSRKITHITEVLGMEGDTIVLQDLFLYKETGGGQGRFFSAGIRPKFISQLEEEGLSVSPSWFRGEW